MGSTTFKYAYHPHIPLVSISLCIASNVFGVKAISEIIPLNLSKNLIPSASTLANKMTERFSISFTSRIVL